MNIIEFTRELIINDLFNTTSFNSAWDVWKNEISNLTSSQAPSSYFNLGDHLRDIFRTTGNGGRSQDSLSGGGAAWEALITWYLNLVCIGRRTVVVKHKKKFVPEPIRDAITVTYNNFDSNTESDLIAITFPNEKDFAIDKDDLLLYNNDNTQIPLYNRNQKYNHEKIMDALCEKHFSNLEIHIIQCKTNWNDNAQIPMLWDMVYSAQGFGRNINVGKNGKSIRSIREFSYSFVTVPSNNLSNFTPTSTSVLRVSYLSGGNYWGLDSRTAVARSVKELASQNLSSGHEEDIIQTLQAEIPLLDTKYSYFKL